MQLRLNTLENTRASFGRVLREYAAGRIEDQYARTLGYLFAQYLSYWKLEKDIKIEERIDALEEQVKGDT